MKYSLVLFLTLGATWMVWSGHTEWFLLIVGALSILLTMVVCWRMRLVDQESVPIHLILGSIPYSIFLLKEIVISNIAVSKIILSPKMELHRNMFSVEAKQKTEIGNVILANSITLTPGTVSVSMSEDKILVHALSYEGAEEDLAGDMEERVAQLEGKS
ncbi:MAG: Na+/H+ antiporter subunit E [Planctomycetota bacterium]